MRFKSCGASFNVCNSEPEAKYLAKPRKVSTPSRRIGHPPRIRESAKAIDVDVLRLDEFQQAVFAVRSAVTALLKPPHGVCPMPCVYRTSLTQTVPAEFFPRLVFLFVKSFVQTLAVKPNSYRWLNQSLLVRF